MIEIRGNFMKGDLERNYWASKNHRAMSKPALSRFQNVHVCVLVTWC